MKERYRLFLRRKSVYYAFDTHTKRFESLKTREKSEANRLLVAMNEAGHQAAMNLSLARVYLRHSDPMVAQRTWQHVLEEMILTKTGENQRRWKIAAKDKAFDSIRNRPLAHFRGNRALPMLNNEYERALSHHSTQRPGRVSATDFVRVVPSVALFTCGNDG